MGIVIEPETTGPQASGVFAIGLTTLARKDIVRFTLPRLRSQFPNVPIYVADQNGDFENEELYTKTGVRVIWLEKDVGISKARNVIMAQAREPYVLLIDDDDLPEQHCDTRYIEELCSLLDANERWFVIGGSYADRPPFARELEISSVEKGHLVRTASVQKVIVNFFGQAKELTKVDIVSNFAIFARERLLNSGVVWDDELKVMEHTDFYLSLKKFRERTGNGEVVFFDNLRLSRAVVTSEKEYKEYRFRYQYINLMARKWGLVKDVDATVDPPKVSWVSRDAGWAAALNLLSTILDKQEITHWVSDGTLLGLIREGNFIAHDTDIDVTVVGDKNQLRPLESALLGAGFRVMRAWGVPGRGLEWAVLAPAPEGGNWPFGRVKIDLFFADKTTTGYRVATYRGRLASWKCLEQTRVERVKFPQLGLTLPIPADPQRALKAEYGDQWETPTTDWDYWSSPKNICSGPKTQPVLSSFFYKIFLLGRAGGSMWPLFSMLVISKLPPVLLMLARSIIKFIVGPRGLEWIRIRL